MGEDLDDSPVINFEKIHNSIAFYKFPLILTALGVILVLISLIFLLKNQKTKSGVVFSTEATESAKTKIKVDVEGSVGKPGVYEFVEGDRVSDAISSAGGLTDQADLDWMEKNLNQAAKLIDGGKIYIPKIGEGKVPASAKAPAGEQNSGNNLLGVTTGLININTASQAELEALPGVGPVTAGKIIDGRSYISVEELKTKKVIGNALYEKIKDKLTI